MVCITLRGRMMYRFFGKVGIEHVLLLGIEATFVVSLVFDTHT